MSVSSGVVKQFESCRNFVDELDITNLQLDDQDITKIIEWGKTWLYSFKE